MKLLWIITKASLTVSIFLLLGCFRKPAGLGQETHLFVIADSTNWVVLEPTFRDVFEKVIKTPQPEKVFAVHWVSPAQFNQFATRKNLVIAGALDLEGEIDRKIANMLTPEVKRKVTEGSAFVFPKEEPWAKNQLLVVLVSNSLSELQEKLLANKQFVYELFQKKLLRETVDDMYETMEQTDLARELLQKYGWTVRIQHDYIIHTERPQDRFIMLRRSLPGRERWLFVHWIDDGDSSQINDEWAIQTRNKLTRKFYQNDYIDEKNTAAKRVNFLNRPAVMLEGLWANDENVAGGPFRNYTFYDEASGRIYMIDIAVFFPGGEKEPFLRQLDVMAHSFQTAQEMNQETVEEAS